MGWPTDLDFFPSATFPTAAALHSHSLATDAHSTLHAALASRVVDFESRIGVPAAPADGSILARLTALEASIANLRDGWFADPDTDPAHRWTRVSGTSFTITSPASRAADFYCGLKVKWIDSVGQKYGVVYNATVTGPVLGNYTTTVNLIPTTDFVMDVTVQQASCATSTAERPKGFPGMFIWKPGITTPSNTTLSNGNRGTGAGAGGSGRWYVVGRFLLVEFAINWASPGIAQGTEVYRITLPVVTRSLGNNLGMGVASIRTGGVVRPGTVQSPGAVNYVTVQVLDAATALGSTGNPMISAQGVSNTSGQPNTWKDADFINATAMLPLPTG